MGKGCLVHQHWPPGVPLLSFGREMLLVRAKPDLEGCGLCLPCCTEDLLDAQPDGDGYDAIQVAFNNRQAFRSNKLKNVGPKLC